MNISVIQVVRGVLFQIDGFPLPPHSKEFEKNFGDVEESNKMRTQKGLLQASLKTMDDKSQS